MNKNKTALAACFAVVCGCGLSVLSGCGYSARDEYYYIQSLVVRPAGWPTNDRGVELPENKYNEPSFPKSWSAQKIAEKMEHFRSEQGWTKDQIRKNYPRVYQFLDTMAQHSPPRVAGR